MKTKQFYESPASEVITLITKGTACQAISDPQGFGDEEDWDKEEGE